MGDFEALSNEAGKKLFEPARTREWLQDADLKALKKAVKAKDETVIVQGVKYRITYGFRRNYPVSKEVVDSIRLSRHDGGFVPMGYIPIKKIMSA